MEGYILIHKKIIDWEWYTDPNVNRLFIHLLIKSNYSDKRWRGTEIKRGELITSIQHLSSELELSSQQIKTALDKLVLSKEIKKESTNKYTRIIILKYDFYQNGARNFNQDSNKQNIHERTNNRLSNNQQLTTTKEYKEEEINKENKEVDSAINFLKNDKIFWNKFEAKFKNKIFEFDIMLNSFGYKVIEEEIKFKKEILQARISRYALNWVKNQKNKTFVQPTFEKNR